jgi:trehalose 6-phosphate synthase complex regulatory subunit
MNLTSHEFVVCQDGQFDNGKKHGSLILSEFTGTSALFRGNQLSVNPWSYRQCSEAIKKAIEMPDEEKATRWDNLHKAVLNHTGGQWFNGFLSNLDRVYAEQHRRDQTSVPRLNLQSLGTKYSGSSRRLFFLDLEGTLMPYNPMSSIVPMNPQVCLTRARQ